LNAFVVARLLRKRQRRIRSSCKKALSAALSKADQLLQRCRRLEIDEELLRALAFARKPDNVHPRAARRVAHRFAGVPLRG
jgi:hypothetical protein